MKGFIIYLSVLAIILAIGIGTDLFLRHKTDKLVEILKELEAEVTSDEPLNSYIRLNKEWQKTKHKLELLTNHKELVPIDNNFKALEVFLQDPDKKTETIALIREIQILLQNIPHQMELRPENLF
ncbi:MAG TPA: DUF4363 family protein [Clostridia bacterium]|nr:DUF4363 family protein [Clostridia bacterium]